MRSHVASWIFGLVLLGACTKSEEETDTDVETDTDTDSDSDADSDADSDSDTDTDPPLVDEDGDTFANDVDCNDGNPLVHPGATENCDTIDSDCDGQEADGLATFFPTDGEPRNVTLELGDRGIDADGFTVAENGNLQLCGGEWSSNVSIDADVWIVGINGATLDGMGATTVDVLAGRYLKLKNIQVSSVYGGEQNTTAAVAVNLRGGAIADLDEATLTDAEFGVRLDEAAEVHIVSGEISAVGTAVQAVGTPPNHALASFTDVDVRDVGAVGVAADADFTLTNTRVERTAAATTVGMLVINPGSSLEVFDSSFSHLDFLSPRSVVFANDSAVTIDGSSFQHITGGNALVIGGNDVLSVVDTSFSDITGAFDGGAVAISGGAVPAQFDNVTFSGTTALRWGGGLYAQRATTVVNSTFEGSKAVIGGGVYASGDFSVTDSAFHDNHAEDTGGGIFFEGGVFVASNSSFVANAAGTPDCESCTAGTGGAITLGAYGEIASILGGTFTLNTATKWGGAIYRSQCSTPALVLNNVAFGDTANANLPDSVRNISVSHELSGAVTEQYQMGCL